MGQEHDDYAEPGCPRRLPPLWVAGLVATICLILVIFFGDQVDEVLGAFGLRKARD
jgi:hypothetical protein